MVNYIYEYIRPCLCGGAGRQPDSAEQKTKKSYSSEWSRTNELQVEIDMDTDLRMLFSADLDVLDSGQRGCSSLLVYFSLCSLAATSVDPAADEVVGSDEGGDEVVYGASSDGARRRRSVRRQSSTARHVGCRQGFSAAARTGGGGGQGLYCFPEDDAGDRARPPPPRAGIWQEISLRLRRGGRQRGRARSSLVRLRLAWELGRRLASASAGEDDSEDGHDPSWSASASHGNLAGDWPLPPPPRTTARTGMIQPGPPPARAGITGTTEIAGERRE